MNTFTCEVCGRAWASSRQRATHEQKAHPEWVAPPDVRAERGRDKRRRWVAKQSTAWRFIGDSNRQARQYGQPPIFRSAGLPDGPCTYCGGLANGWDHVVPLVRGGPHTIANLVPCCRACNLRKNDGPPERASVPSTLILLCGWCWKPMLRRTKDLRQARYVCCREHINKLRRNPLPFGTRAFSRRRADGNLGYHVRPIEPMTLGLGAA